MEALKRDINQTFISIKETFTDIINDNIKNLEEKIGSLRDQVKVNEGQIMEIKDRVSKVEDKAEKTKDDLKDTKHDLERRIDNSLNDIKLDISDMRGELKTFIEVCNVSEDIEEKQHKKLWENVKFWITICLMLLSFIVGFFGMNGVSIK